MKYEKIFSTVTTFYIVQAVSDENVTVIDREFNNIPVRLYLPKRKLERKRPAVIFIHGGIFVFGSCTALEDCVHVIKFFLQDKVLAKYRVDPSRICIMGDSSGGTLAATVTQLLRNDPEFKNRIKAQALLYPGLQMIDTFLPSHREYGHGPILHREMMLRVASLYVTKDSSLTQALLRNEHMPEGSRHLFKFVNWSDFLPEKYKKNHVYTEPVLGKLNASYPALMDSRLFPLLVNDSQLQNLPLTYIFTCEHDLLRDDSFIYITRLRNVGVRVIHEHMEEGVHGAISFTTGTLALHLGFKIRD
ncbi:mCG132333, partial [Mus musculus]